MTIDPDGVLRPLRPPKQDVDSAAAEQAKKIKRDAALVRAIKLLRR